MSALFAELLCFDSPPSSINHALFAMVCPLLDLVVYNLPVRASTVFGKSPLLEFLCILGFAAHSSAWGYLAKLGIRHIPSLEPTVLLHVSHHIVQALAFQHKQSVDRRPVLFPHVGHIRDDGRTQAVFDVDGQGLGLVGRQLRNTRARFVSRNVTCIVKIWIDP